MDGIDHKEIYLLIAHFLKAGPCQDATKVLIEECARKKLLPARTDWMGTDHSLSFTEAANHIPNVNSGRLLKILCRAMAITQQVNNIPSTLTSLIGNFFLKSGNDYCYLSSPLEAIIKRSSFGSERNGNLHYILSSGQLRGLARRQEVLQPYHWEHYKLLQPVLGHLAPIYCLSYDKTGQYIVTGSDDHLLKIWSQKDGRMLATFRGHAGEISDIAFNQDNTLLASAGNDKTIRVWCCQTGAPVQVLLGHTGIVTSVQFIPNVRSETRYLVSTSTDGFAMFWQYNASTLEFNPTPIKFMEKNRMGDQTLCSAYSTGGTYFVTGCSDHTLRIYDTSGEAPTSPKELTGHTDRITVVQCSRTGKVCFATGARDGTGRLWHFVKGNWKSTILPACQLGEPSLTGVNQSSKWKRQVTMVTFDCTDSYIFTASSPDCTVRLWDVDTGAALREYKGHSNEVFALESHPLDPRIFISAGHDGVVNVWDTFSGEKLKMECLEFEDEGAVCVYDCKFSPDGTNFATVDSHGHTVFFGMGSSKPYKKFPQQQFYHTDYRPLVRDRLHYVLDEQAQVPPHLMPPPVLVDMDGNTHPLGQQIAITELICKPGTLKKEQWKNSNAKNQSTKSDLARGSTASSNTTENVPLSDRMSCDLLTSVKVKEQTSENSTPLSGPDLNQGSATASLGSAVALTGNGSVPGGHVSGGDLRNTLEPAPLGIVWSNIFTEAEYKDAVRLWQNRTIIRGLDHDELQSICCQLSSLYESEINHFTRESQLAEQYTRYSETLAENVVSPSGSEGRKLRSGRRLADSTDDESECDIDVVLPEDNDLDEASSTASEPDFTNMEDDSESYNSSDISDWTAEAGVSLLSASTMKRRTRRDYAVESPKLGNSSDNNENSSVADPTIGFTAINYKDYNPSSWLTQTTPLVQPYYPQVGDQVVYFRQGHELYLKAVKEDDIFPLRGIRLPWKKINLEPHELCHVKNIHFIVGPPTLCSITLALVNAPVDMPPNLRTFSFKFHDMDGVLDFMIPVEYYKEATSRTWQKGDKFRAFIEGSWYTGKVLRREPFSDTFPNSSWLCYKVVWEDNEGEEVESISPWDMEPINESETLTTPRVLIPDGEKGNWDDENVHIARERILDGIEDIFSKVEEAKHFITPVDLTEYPNYCTVVPLPMDLTMIKARLQNYFYRRKIAILWDVVLLYRNALSYNEEDSVIVHQALVVAQMLCKYIHDPACNNVTNYYDPSSRSSSPLNLVKISVTQDEPSTSNEILEENLGNTAPITRKRKYSPTEWDNTRKRRSCTISQDWNKTALEILQEILKKPFAEPFVAPVDTEVYTDYMNFVKTPIDLDTIEKKLQREIYASPDDYVADLQLMISNSEVYNTNSHSLIFHLTQQLKTWLQETLPLFWSNVCISEWKDGCQARMAQSDIESNFGNSTNKKTKTPSVSSATAADENSVESDDFEHYSAEEDSVNSVHSDISNSSSEHSGSEDEYQPISKRLRRRSTKLFNVSTMSSKENCINQPVVITRLGRTVKPTFRFSTQ